MPACIKNELVYGGPSESTVDREVNQGRDRLTTSPVAGRLVYGETLLGIATADGFGTTWKAWLDPESQRQATSCRSVQGPMSQISCARERQDDYFAEER